MMTIDTFPRAALDPARTTGLIMCGMGGPDGPEAVQPFLRNLFRDPNIFPAPRLVAGIAGRFIAWKRAPKVRERYAMISEDSSTPQLPTTRKQAVYLAEKISETGRGTLPGVAMRYWDPFPDQTVAELMKAGARQFLIVPTFPQYSGATNGSTIRFVLDALGKIAPNAPVHVVPDWHLLPGFIEAVARPVITQLTCWADDRIDPGECALLYVAHSLPESFIRKGDPYLDRTRATVNAVHQLVTKILGAAENGAWLNRVNGGAKPELCFQSKVGPVKWLGPQIENEVSRLARAGARRLLVQPVSFTCEHIETLLELDIELKARAIDLGVEDFHRGPALNLNGIWLDSLADHMMDEAFSTEVGRIGPEV
ncbi:MAG: ferrochelatase [Candidatus Krumholzibacteria bacterium]|nr:ferrochelatase [Candidatus Krumholzibacteria bacterium]